MNFKSLLKLNVGGINKNSSTLLCIADEINPLQRIQSLIKQGKARQDRLG